MFLFFHLFFFILFYVFHFLFCILNFVFRYIFFILIYFIYVFFGWMYLFIIVFCRFLVQFFKLPTVCLVYTFYFKFLSVNNINNYFFHFLLTIFICFVVIFLRDLVYLFGFISLLHTYVKEILFCLKRKYRKITYFCCMKEEKTTSVMLTCCFVKFKCNQV